MQEIITSDVLQGLKTLPDGIIDTCVTSPPYFGLRDYGINGQIGLEETPDEYIAKLVEVFREVKRVLRDDGTLWIVIADSYAGSGKGGAAYPENAKKYKQGTSKGMLGAVATTKVKTPNCKSKDLIGVPWMLAFALRADGWYLRQDIIWHKTNSMPESVTDRCTKAHEYIFLLSKSPRYYFDNDAVKEPAVNGDPNPPRGSKGVMRVNSGRRKQEHAGGGRTEPVVTRNRRDVWTVTTKPYKGAHFAVFPPDLIRPCIMAGSRKGGIVLDPFLGSGTTAAVALKEGRGYVGIEINPKYVKLANLRIKKIRQGLCQTQLFS